MELTVAAVQMAMADDVDANVATAERLVREAAAAGGPGRPAARAVRGPVLLQGHAARALRPGPPGRRAPDRRPLRALAAELDVVLPLSVYERANRATYNSVVVIDADGVVLGTYRKSHIPDGPGYTEKYYFNPGDTGFRVWPTRHGVVGVGICWDQWFPESARCMALLGADVLLYPTAIGSEPPDPDWDSSGHWQRVMQGHAGANLTPLVAANRIGHEVGRDDRDHVLRVVVHRRRHRRQGRRGRPRRRGGARGDVRPRRGRRDRATRGACSATAGPTSTARCSPSTATHGRRAS